MLKTRNALTGVVLAAALVTAGCTGQDDKGFEGSDEDALAAAKENLDETPAVDITLKAEDLPSGISGIVVTAAEGTGQHPHSFKGKLTGSLSGLTQEGEVVAIDGKVWIKLLQPEFEEVDPADYNAPDPGQLMETEGGLSDLLVATEDVEKGEERRGGDDNDEVFTEYSGTLAGDLVKVVIPSASEDTFDVTYAITGDGVLREMELTGQFYPDSADMTYVLTFDNYGEAEEIKAP